MAMSGKHFFHKIVTSEGIPSYAFYTVKPNGVTIALSAYENLFKSEKLFYAVQTPAEARSCLLSERSFKKVAELEEFPL